METCIEQCSQIFWIYATTRRKRHQVTDKTLRPPPSLQSVDIEKERELERQARIEASLREREREVQKARSEQTKEIDREREQHKREEAIQHFKALMSDMVRCRVSHSTEITN